MLQGEVGEAVAALKQEDGDHLLVIGSTQLVQTLIEHDLVDEYRSGETGQANAAVASSGTPST